MERRDILRRVLEFPPAYAALQDLLGARKSRQRLVEMLNVRPGERVLDVGCGPADILEHLPKLDYVGIDYSSKYIEAARRKFGSRGRFLIADLATIGKYIEGRFDLVMAIGVLHHLDDETAREMLRAARECLEDGGRFFAIDPLIEHPQSLIARSLISLDRGKFVRSIDKYAELVGAIFESYSIEPRRDMLRVPYSHAITFARK